jgi:hypothetical protein
MNSIKANMVSLSCQSLEQAIFVNMTESDLFRKRLKLIKIFKERRPTAGWPQLGQKYSSISQETKHFRTAKPKEHEKLSTSS